MPPAFADFRSPVASPQQMQSKSPPSLQNPNPSFQTPSHFGLFASNNQSEQCQASSNTDLKTANGANSFSIDNASDDDFNCSFSSLFVSRVSSGKSNISSFSGRSRPRLMKVRRQSGSQQQRSASVSARSGGSGFNPSRPVTESSNRVEEASAPNVSSASVGAVKFGNIHNVGFVFSASKSDSVSNSNTQQTEPSGITGHSSAGEFVNFNDLGFAFCANESRLTSNLDSEKKEYSANVGQSGGHELGTSNNAGSLFGSNKSYSAPNPNLEQRESNASDSNEFGKFKNVGFVFSSNKSNLVSNLNLEKKEYSKSVGKLNSSTYGKPDNVGFAFGANKSNLALNSNLENRELGESGGISCMDEAGKSDNVGSVFGCKKSNASSDRKESGGVMAKLGVYEFKKFSSVVFASSSILAKSASGLNLEESEPSENERIFSAEKGKVKEENKPEFRKLDDLGFVSGAERRDSVSNLNVRKEESSEDVGKLDAGGNAGKFYYAGSVFGTDYREISSYSKLESREFNENIGKSVSFDGRNVESKAQEGKVDNKCFVFRANQSYLAPSAAMEKKEFSESAGKSVFVDRGSDVKYSSVLGSSSNSGSVFGKNPLYKLSDEMKTLNIDDSEKVNGANKTNNTNSCANVDGIFVFGSNKKPTGCCTGILDISSWDQLKDANLEGPEYGSAIKKTGGVNIKTSGKRIPASKNYEKSAGSFRGIVENMMPDEMRNTNIGSGAGVFGEPINSCCSCSGISGKENQPMNVYEGSLAGTKSPQDQPHSVSELNKASSLSSFLSMGFGFQSNGSVSEAFPTGGVEKEEFNFTSTPFAFGTSCTDVSTPNLGTSCSFTANLFPGLSQKLEFSAKSRSIRDKRLKRREKLRQGTLVQQWAGQDHLSKESSFQQNHESSGCPSPMDFSPYQVTNCAPSAAPLAVPVEAKDEDLAAAREGYYRNEADKKCTGPNEKGPGDHPESCFAKDCPVEEFASGAINVTIDIHPGVASAETEGGFFSIQEREASDFKTQFCSASTSENCGERNFTFCASSSAQDNLSATRRQYRKKYKMKVRCGANYSTLSGNFEFSSARFSPLSGNSLHLNMAQVQQGAMLNSQSKGENISEADKEHSKQGPSEATTQEACKRWRIRGNKAYSNGDLSKAEDFYTKGIDSVPHTSMSGCCIEPLVLCYSNRAATRMSLGRMREALRDCAMAAALDPNFLKVQIRAAKCHLVLGEVEDATRCFSKCLESGSVVCLDRRITIEAADGLQKAQKVAEWTSRSDELLQQRTSEAASSALGMIVEAMSISCYSEKLHEMKGEALCVLRKYEEVIQLCEQTLDFAERNFVNNLANADDLDCKNSFVRLWRWHLMSKSYYHLGKLESALDLIEKQEQSRSARDEYRSMAHESSIPLAVTVRELLRHKKAGNDAFQSGRHIEAVEHYTAAISSSVESRPFAAICFCNRAAAHQALGQIVDAIADCSLAIALDGNYPKAVSRRATLHEAIRDYDQAANDLQRLISILEYQSHDIAQYSATPDRPTGSSIKELRRARRHLSLMEEKAKKGTPLNLYLILGIKVSDTDSEIKKAYRKAALRHHPDKAGQFLARSESGADGQLWNDIVDKIHKDADRLFKMIGEAYAILSDPTKRSKYDLEEEMREAQKKSGGSGSSGKPSSFYSSPFERSSNRRSWQESWKTHGNSRSHW